MTRKAARIRIASDPDLEAAVNEIVEMCARCRKKGSPEKVILIEAEKVAHDYGVTLDEVRWYTEITEADDREV